MKIFVEKKHGSGLLWDLLEETDVVSFLSNPANTGEIMLHNPKDSILEEITDLTCFSNQVGNFRKGVHFATNYGLATFYGSGTTRILPYSKDSKGLCLIQLTDMIVDYDSLPKGVADLKVDLIANRMKMSDCGRNFRIDGNIEDVLDEIKKVYRFVSPAEGQFVGRWVDEELFFEIQKQREKNITDEFVNYLNENYYSWHLGINNFLTKDEIKKHFDIFSLS